MPRSYLLVPRDVGTSGGIVTDEYGRALRGDGSVIEGLYATFARASNEPLLSCGRASIGASFVFAWIAAHHAVRANV